MSTPLPARRRFIGITAAAAALSLAPGALCLAHAASRPQPAQGINPITWRGVALGADAELRLYHPSPAFAQRLLHQALAEIHRLENLFSLYRHDSALAQLNRQGHLAHPPADLVRLLSESAHYSRLTGGAFDPSVQPLWNLYAQHFQQAGANPAGPAPRALQKALKRVGYQHIQISRSHIRLQQPGMALTLNGIAQGYITDRITDLLRAGGLPRALVDLGEIRGLDDQPGSAPWRVGLARPDQPNQTHTTVAIRNQALATSGGYGTPLDPAGRHTHLFNPHTGHAQPRQRSVSVLGGTATMADALSTAFSHMPLADTAPLVQQLELTAWFVLADGTVQIQGSPPPAQS